MARDEPCLCSIRHQGESSGGATWLCSALDFRRHTPGPLRTVGARVHPVHPVRQSLAPFVMSAAEITVQVACRNAGGGHGMPPNPPHPSVCSPFVILVRQHHPSLSFSPLLFFPAPPLASPSSPSLSPHRTAPPTIVHSPRGITRFPRSRLRAGLIPPIHPLLSATVHVDHGAHHSNPGDCTSLSHSVNCAVARLLHTLLLLAPSLLEPYISTPHDSSAGSLYTLLLGPSISRTFNRGPACHTDVGLGLVPATLLPYLGLQLCISPDL